MDTAFVLTNGLLRFPDAKTAHGLIRGTERYTITAVIDGIDTAGEDAGIILDGKKRNIPVFASLQDAIHHLGLPHNLIIGVATVGGRLPGNMLDIVIEAIRSGISIVNGLHEYLTDKPDIVALAATHKVQLTDIRKPKSREQLHFWNGDVFKVGIPIIAVLGMDCAMGKRTTARMLKQACIADGIQAEMIYTGQTGWLQGGKYGFIFDSTLNDFVSGELEHAIVSCRKETGAEILFLEGQSSLRNPSGPCGIELLISGHAKHVVLAFAPKRKYFDLEPHWGEIPSVESEIKLIELLGSKVIALVLNGEDCTEAEIYHLRQSYEQKLGIPVLLTLQEGVHRMLPIFRQLIKEKTTQ